MTRVQHRLIEAASGPAKARSVPSRATDADPTAERLQGHSEILAAARRWYEAELERCARAHRTCWREHQEWVEAYLREEVRLRLVARGWEPTNVV